MSENLEITEKEVIEEQSETIVVNEKLAGKSIQELELGVSNTGYSSAVKVVLAKQNDDNSRYIHPIIYDGTKIMECKDSIIRCNGKLPNGASVATYGEIINGKPYIKINKSFLNQVGVVPCDISIITPIADLSATSGISQGITTVEINSDIFANKTEKKSGVYVFIYSNSNWKLADNNVLLDDFGVMFEGEPIEGDRITVDYSSTSTLTTETFYIIVKESVYGGEPEDT